METIQRLQHLSLISKVTTELDNHLGLNDKDAAEFLVDLADKSASLSEFRKNLENNGGEEFPDQFVENLYKLIKKMKPGSKKPTKVIKLEDEAEKREKPTTNPLSMPNSKPELSLDPANDEMKDQSPKRERSWRDRDTRDEREKVRHSPSRDRGRDRDRIHDRRIDRYGRSLDRNSRSDRDRSRDRYHGDRDRDYRFSRRSPSPRWRRSRSRSRSRDRYRSRREDYSPVRKRVRDLDRLPVVGKIYEGTVTNVKDFGAFVRLLDVEGHSEGLIHVSNLENRRVESPHDVISRNDMVKVKVLDVTHDERKMRVSLSLKDVDQRTGEDISSMKRGGIASRDWRDEPVVPVVDRDVKKRAKRRMTSQERFDLLQMKKAGVAGIAYQDLEEEDDGPEIDEPSSESELDDAEIELNHKEPTFLRGRVKEAAQLSPARVTPMEDGSMARAAMQQSSLAAERRMLKREQEKALKGEKVDDWDDPMSKSKKKPEPSDPSTYVPEWKTVVKPKDAPKGRRTNLSIKEQRETLPIFYKRNDLLQAVKQSQFLVVVGETGSGKTTQITQYLAEVGYAQKGIIGCTQPRRVAATSVAKRVAEEVGCRLGQDVGYTIRFEDCTSDRTRIKYMTDGMLLRECLMDPDLSRYSVLMLDEAHERSINTDVLFGLLKEAGKRRPDLKIIVTSATLDAEKFSKYFNSCYILKIAGRTFPVQVLYAQEPETDYLDASLITVMQIHLSQPPGDILLFLTGQEEIDTASQILYERMKALGDKVPELVILPIYSALPAEMQSRIFEPAPPGGRKVVIATNIAETSLTIDGIYYVVDPGFVKQKVYNPKTGMDALLVTPISKAQANQRSGRAGRTGPGKCFRLYTENAYKNEMLAASIPEIQRTNMANTVLTLKALGINDLLNFDFMDRPAEPSMISAMYQLYSLNALDDEGLLTRIGRKMAEFPLDPPLAKMLLASVDLQSSEEVLTIVSMLSVEQVFYRPKEKQQLADHKKSKFHQPEGDHLTYLTVYEAWKASGYSGPWCFDNFIQHRSLKRAQDVRKQLQQIMDRYKLDIVSCGRNYDRVRKSIVSGYFVKAARKDPTEGYRTLVEGTPVYIHPGSALFQRKPDWVVYHELIQTTREYMRDCTAIEPKWLVEFAGTFYQIADKNKLTKRQRDVKIQPLHNRHQGEDEWRISKALKYH